MTSLQITKILIKSLKFRRSSILYITIGLLHWVYSGSMGAHKTLELFVKFLSSICNIRKTG